MDLTIIYSRENSFLNTRVPQKETTIKPEASEEIHYSLESLQQESVEKLYQNRLEIE